MKTVLRPIRGFGVVGLLLLPVLGALVFCAAGGFDLRLAIFSKIYHGLGERVLSEIVIFKLMFGSYWMSMVGVVCGPITLTLVLPAMFLAPRRWPWWSWIVVSVWLLLNPWLCLEFSKVVRVDTPALFGIFAGRGPRVLFASEVHWVSLAQIGLLSLLARWIARASRLDVSPSRWRWAPLALFVIGATLATIAWQVDRAATPWLGYWGFVALGTTWHASVAVLLIGSAIAARRRFREETWLCRTCGYDLRGLSPGVAGSCPECGSSAESNAVAAG